MMKVKLKELTLEEKTALVAGTGNMYTNPVPRLGIPGLTFADGPHGLRKQIGTASDNVSNSEPATAFPTAVTTASSWNTNNLYAMGLCIGEECRHYGVNVLLGPGVNIKKNPTCGRNFEYFSEDPYLAGTLGAQMVEGVQSKGVGVSVKHFALNQSENFRMISDSVCDMRAMREIYLNAFERIVKAKPTTLMCAYNKINGEHCSENELLLNKILRKEWGFDGLVMSDWGTVKDRVKGIKNGLDLEMPGDTAYCRRKLIDSVKNKSLDEKYLDTAVERVLDLIDKTYYTELSEVDFEAHHALSGRIAEDSAVLMKNDGFLPLNKKERVCVVGDLFDNMRYQGAGSSQINPTKITTPKNAFDTLNIDYDYAKGYDSANSAPDYELIDEAVKISTLHEKVLLFIGLTDDAESEGEDRTTISLPENQLALIDAIVETGVKVGVVLFSGSVSDTGYSDKVSAILNMFLPGQNGGTAVANLVFGAVSPSGRLSESWVKSLSDVPFNDFYAKTPIEVYYESIFVGYRYYVTAGKKVKYPFGFGLSYTAFEYENMELSNDEDNVYLSVTLKNVGSCAGAEVVQLYVESPKTDVFKAKRVLKGFKKVYLESGESKKVEIIVPKAELRYFNIYQDRWVLENGNYNFEFCSDCETVILEKSYYESSGEEVSTPYCDKVLDVYGSAKLENVTDEIFEEMSGLKIPELPKTKPFTVESRVADLKEGVMGRIVLKCILSFVNKKKKKALLIQDEKRRKLEYKAAIFVERNILSNCLRAMSMADKRLPLNYAEGIIALANFRFIKAIGCFIKKIRVPKLPKDQK